MNMEKIPEPYRSLTVEAGKQGKVFECFAHGKLGKVRGLYCGWAVGTYLTIDIDGRPLERKTERQIGESTVLEKYDPPLEFCDKFTVTGYNNKSEAYTFEVIVNGEIYD